MISGALTAVSDMTVLLSPLWLARFGRNLLVQKSRHPNSRGI
jgi:hypothetical protein